MSTRGVTLEQEGFIHCSTRDQVEATANRFYGDVPQLVVLTIDPRAVPSPIRFEPPAPGSADLFPHIYGPLPIAAVDRRHVLDPRRRRLDARLTRRPVVRSVPGTIQFVGSSNSLCSGGRGASTGALVGDLVAGALFLFERGLLLHEPFEAAQADLVEPSGGDRRLHGAAGFLIVLAVAEPAAVHQVEHVGEGPLDAVARQPQAQRPHARRVDQPTLTPQRHEFGGDRRVPATLVALAHRRRRLAFVADAAR